MVVLRVCYTHHAASSCCDVSTITVHFILRELVCVAVQVKIDLCFLKQRCQIFNINFISGMVPNSNNPIIAWNFLYSTFQPVVLSRTILFENILVKHAVTRAWILRSTRVPLRLIGAAVVRDARGTVNHNKRQILAGFTQLDAFGVVQRWQVPTVVVWALVLRLCSWIEAVVVISQNTIPRHHQTILVINLLKSILPHGICGRFDTIIIEIVPRVQNELRL